MATPAVVRDKPWLMVPLTLHYRYGRKRAAHSVLTVLIGAASREAFAGYCLACRISALPVSAGAWRRRRASDASTCWGSVALDDEPAAMRR